MRHSIPSTAAEAVRHLYVHVPFCPTICPFCSFHVLERTGSLVETYLDTLERELESIARTVELVPDTVYVGGGTPSYLKPGEIERLVAMIDDRFGWARVEATLEVHPSTATAERVGHWNDLGFDRLSVGVQSFDDAVLRRLGRPHTAAAATETVSWCVQSPSTTSLDVISAVPGQSLDDELAAAIDLGVDHVSVYTLTIEEGTPFQRAGVTVDNDVEVAAIETAGRVLTAAGFERYEVSNYARPRSEERAQPGVLDAGPVPRRGPLRGEHGQVALGHRPAVVEPRDGRLGRRCSPGGRRVRGSRPGGRCAVLRPSDWWKVSISPS